LFQLAGFTQAPLAGTKSNVAARLGDEANRPPSTRVNTDSNTRHRFVERDIFFSFAACEADDSV